MKMWSDVRRSVLTGKLSKRQACRQFNIHWGTLEKMLSEPEPPKQRRPAARPKPKLDPFLSIIHEILTADLQQPKKQRHTAKRIFERLRDEHGFAGKLTVVHEAVRLWREKRREVFMPLAHPPGEAQFDFGEAKAVYRGREIKVMFCVMSLPYSDAFFCQAFPRECTETFQEGTSVRSSSSVACRSGSATTTSKIAVAKIVGRRGADADAGIPAIAVALSLRPSLLPGPACERKGPHGGTWSGFARRNFMVPHPRVRRLRGVQPQTGRRLPPGP